MTTNMEKYILKKRPNISNSSLKTYESILRNLYYKIFGKADEPDLSKFEDSNKIIKFLKELEPRKRKTVLSALVIITDDDKYRELMLDDIKEYNKEEAKQKKTAVQKENWIENDELINIYKILKKNAELLYKKQHLTNNDYQEIQNFIILSLLGGFYIPPRRSKDYVDFKIKNIDKAINNYIGNNKLIFNSYKTNKFYGQQQIDIPKELKSILKKWIKKNPTEYLLFDTSLNPLTNVKLNQRLNRLFGKKASINQLRKSYLSNKYSDLIDKKNDLNDDMIKMGSSKIQENIYIKND